ncbi:hypothetical protein CEUSTIGMA_g2636.t1 [Chlamydomonas eustigma]|uniref:ditrans,polycis-polyprenyl diphosphate synthase [(2E,6E)-farnesyldiphosphate specific] n=1 Tax=Chlamydomonas eustigma TaxID=1157962 RepID=A0A250WX48_9CHLO|nr:hypothetical protein CEUSTIGMA_g2636.t1 [Chlamydomonas eustigma]|eukprot:GAX75192.1 hypothetical protein CEUSTIGMA_g2636.t1 [Chlamydomonas eustigma]
MLSFVANIVEWSQSAGLEHVFLYDPRAVLKRGRLEVEMHLKASAALRAIIRPIFVHTGWHQEMGEVSIICSAVPHDLKLAPPNIYTTHANTAECSHHQETPVFEIGKHKGDKSLATNEAPCCKSSAQGCWSTVLSQKILTDSIPCCEGEILAQPINSSTSIEGIVDCTPRRLKACDSPSATSVAEAFSPDSLRSTSSGDGGEKESTSSRGSSMDCAHVERGADLGVTKVTHIASSSTTSVAGLESVTVVGPQHDTCEATSHHTSSEHCSSGVSPLVKDDQEGDTCSTRECLLGLGPVCDLKLESKMISGDGGSLADSHQRMQNSFQCNQTCAGRSLGSLSLSHEDAMHVHILSSEDAFEPILEEVRSKKCSVDDCGAGWSSHTPPVAVDRSYKEAWEELMARIGRRSGSSINLIPSAILIYGPAPTLAGFPPTHTGAAEIYHQGPLSNANKASFMASLSRFLFTEQRFGR